MNIREIQLHVTNEMEKKLKIESGFQLFSRVTHRPSLDKLHPVLFSNGGPEPNTVIQVTGADSTGKTLLITELIARCILPETYDNKPIPGKNSGAVLINTDHHFNLLKLITIMESILRDSNVEHIQSIIQKSLKNLTILNCYSSEQMQFTFQNLERILLEDTTVNFLVVDGILAQYWYDRVVNGASSINMYAIGILNELKKVINEGNVVTVFTKPESEKGLYYLVDYTIHLKKINEEGFMAIMHDHQCKKQFTRNYIIENGLVFEGT